MKYIYHILFVLSQKMSKRGNYAKWTQEQLDLAVQAVLEETLGLNAASRQYEVPKATIKRHAEEKIKEAKPELLEDCPYSLLIWKKNSLHTSFSLKKGCLALPLRMSED